MARTLEPEDGLYRIDGLLMIHGHRVTAEPMQGLWIGWTLSAAKATEERLRSEGCLRVSRLLIDRKRVEGNGHA